MAKSTCRRSRGRTGCRTCRIRKVKCDEARPVCKRCSSTGRRCDGYEVPAAFLSDTADQTKRALLPKVSTVPTRIALSIPASVGASLQLTDTESQCFTYFRDYTTREIPGCFPSSFWHQFVLQLAHLEPAVLHAAVGVGAMHRSARGKIPSLQLVTLVENRHVFALGQYVKAMDHLRSRLQRYGDSKQNAEIALVTCLLFVCLEMLQGNRPGALVHLRNGLSVLSNMPTQARLDHNRDRRYLLVKRERPVMLEQLTDIFARLDLETRDYGQRGPIFQIVSPRDDASPKQGFPAAFDSLDEARYFLGILSSSTHHIRARLLELSSQTRPDRELDLPELWCWEHVNIRRLDPSLDPDLFAQLGTLRANLSHWLTAFDQFAFRENVTQSSSDTRSAIMLEIRHFCVFFYALTWLDDHETACDRFNSMFERIVYLSSTFIDGISSPNTNSAQTPGLSFTLESGAIPSVYLVALKCREPSIRRKAIHLLRNFPCQEGMWEAALVVKFVEQVANLEDAAAAALTGGGEMRPPASCADVPEAARFNDVVVAATEDSGKGRLVCARFMHESTGELSITEHLITL